MSPVLEVAELPQDIASELRSHPLPFALECRGHRFGVVVAPDQFEGWNRELERMRAALEIRATMDDAAARNPGVTEEQVDAEVARALREMNAEQ